MSETSSILILTLVTVILAVYTLLGLMVCLKISEKWMPKWIPWLKENRLRILLVFPFGWLALAVALFAAPAYFLGYLMNDYKLVKDIGPNGRFLVLFGWIVPTDIYIIINLIRKSKSEKK
jgi:ABC-type uncharacterized transport system YnjBCD permease subunit